jgi:phage terminase small subunit
VSKRKAASKSDKKLRLFALEYVIDHNATRAAIAAGYAPKSAHVTGSRMLKKAKDSGLMAELEERAAKRAEIRKDDVLGELKLLGFANMLDYIKPTQDGAAYVDLSRLTREQAAAIQEITVDQYTEGEGEKERTVKKIRFKLADKHSSLVALGKHLKLFTEKVEVTSVPVVLKSSVPRPQRKSA